VSGFLIHRVVGSRTVLSTVEQDTLRVGRGAGVDLRFDDTAVALEHALLRRLPDSGGRAGAYEVVDLGSITGTYRNGEQVASARLADGDEIGIGGWVLKVRWSDPEDPLFLHVRTAEAEPRPDAPPVAAPRVDYAAAYRLRRGLFNKATVSLLAVGVSVVALATRRSSAWPTGAARSATVRASWTRHRSTRAARGSSRPEPRRLARPATGSTWGPTPW